MIFQNFNQLRSIDVMNSIKHLIDRLYAGEKLNAQEFTFLIKNINVETLPYLRQKAVKKRQEIYQNHVYIRGLIEISNICKQDCLYCGIRKSNENVNRYRYDKDTILKIVDHGYARGYRTFVMQGGEDAYYNDQLLSEIIKSIKEKYSDVAVTLSIGERSKESYQKLYDAGADRFLLRHESATKDHYQKLHPESMLLETRMQALKDLKAIGFQTGAGFMVGSPYQSDENIVNELLFLQEFQPEMVGIGPYLTHHDTPFVNEQNGQIDHVLVIYALARLIVPKGLIPSTTATSSLDPQGRLKALESGCNVIMINLSDTDKRQNYTLYENKTYKGDESDEYLTLIKNDIEKAGMEIDFNVGNHISL